MRHSLFYPACLSFIVGIFCASFISLPSIILATLVMLLAVALAYLFYSGLIYRKREVREYSRATVAVIFMLFSLLGMLRYEFFVHYTGDQYLKKLIDQKISAEGIVVTDPEEREQSVMYAVAVDRVNMNNIEPTKILVADQPYSRVRYGDRVKLEGRLTRPENFSSDNGRVFDYVSYLKKDRLLYVMKFINTSIVAHHEGNRIVRSLYSLKRTFIGNLDAVIPYPESRLAAGLTVAGKRALPKSVQDDFKTSGTMQVVVLSGYNVTIIAEAFALVLSSFSKTVAASLGLVGIVLFTTMAGASATVVRGSIMAALVLVAEIFRRRYHLSRALVFSAVAMLAINPMLLVFDPSFQLSFLSTIGLIYFSPIIEHRLGTLTEKINLRKTAAATIGTQLFLLPFLLYQTGALSLMAVPANLALFIVIPITMLLCFIAGMVGYISITLALPAAYAAFLFLWYELKAVHVFASLPFATITFPSLPFWIIALIYGCYVVIIWRFKKCETLGSRAPNITPPSPSANSSSLKLRGDV